MLCHIMCAFVLSCHDLLCAMLGNAVKLSYMMSSYVHVPCAMCHVPCAIATSSASALGSEVEY